MLFTSYHLRGNVYQMLRDEIPFPMIEVWRHAPEEITRFKQMDNAVLFAAGSCWEGVDFPGDMVSSLIIVKPVSYTHLQSVMMTSSYVIG